MTLEGEGPSQDETPAPPARTRWSEDAADDDLGLMPPYVPGGGTKAGGGSALEQGPGAVEPLEPESAPPEPESAPPEAVDSRPGLEPESSAPDETAFPFDPSGGESSERATDAGWGDASGYAEVGETGDFPFDAFDLEGGDETGGAADLPLLESPWVDTARAGGAGSPSAEEAAARLERLADALRRDGRSALQRELESADRLTSLLAGVLAGYLAALED